MLKMKNIPSRHFESVHLRHEWAQPKSTGPKVVSVMIDVNHILVQNECKELPLPLAEEEMR